MPTYTIKNRYTGHVIYTGSADTRKAFLKAIPAGTNLTEADLKGDDLSRVQWAAMNLTRADLRDTDLTDAKFPSTTLTDGDIMNAKVTRTNFVTSTTTRLNTSGTKGSGHKGL